MNTVSPLVPPRMAVLVGDVVLAVSSAAEEGDRYDVVFSTPHRPVAIATGDAAPQNPRVPSIPEGATALALVYVQRKAQRIVSNNIERVR